MPTSMALGTTSACQTVPTLDFGSGNFTNRFLGLPPPLTWGKQFLYNKGPGSGLRAGAHILQQLQQQREDQTSNLSTDGGSWATSFSSTSQWTKNQWQHLALVRSSGTVTLYKNGVVDGSGSISGALTTNTYPANIGAGDSSGKPLLHGLYRRVPSVQETSRGGPADSRLSQRPYTISNVGDVKVYINYKIDTDWALSFR